MSSYAPSRRNPPVSEASVLPGVRGVPFWVAILIAVTGTVIGAIIDAGTSKKLGAGLLVGFVLGAALAALAVRRRAIFTAMVQGPLVLLPIAMIAQRTMSTERLTLSLISVVNIFPAMAIGTGLAIVLGLIRIAAQPLRNKRSALPQSAHA